MGRARNDPATWPVTRSDEAVYLRWVLEELQALRELITERLPAPISATVTVTAAELPQAETAEPDPPTEPEVEPQTPAPKPKPTGKRTRKAAKK